MRSQHIKEQLNSAWIVISVLQGAKKKEPDPNGFSNEHNVGIQND